MRSEQEMLDLILETARSDERIRIVIMNGSRVNPNAQRDCFQDFDISYLVTEMKPFRNNLKWIARFGERIILQLPDEMGDLPLDRHGGFTYLMQFTDGNRIDLGIFPLDKLPERLNDSLSLLLLDKDGVVPSLRPADESSYLPQPPSEKGFRDCCNEFWWVCPYVAKGLWRGEIVYAKCMFDQVVRVELHRLLVWYIGVQTGFKRNPGKFGKFFQQYLDSELWELLLSTYSDADYPETWEALFAAGDLFRRAALQVAGHFGYMYSYEDDHRVTAHLRHVQGLPGNAGAMYE